MKISKVHVLLLVKQLCSLYISVNQDLQRLFPDEKDLVQVTLVEANEILSAFDSRLRSYTERLISKRSAMQIVRASVTGIHTIMYVCVCVCVCMCVCVYVCVCVCVCDCVCVIVCIICLCI